MNSSGCGEEKEEVEEEVEVEEVEEEVEEVVLPQETLPSTDLC